MLGTRKIALLILVTVPVALSSVAAQSAQKLSVQGSGLYINLFGNGFEGFAEAGYGGEAQIRYTPSAWSFGAGFQYTSHDIKGRPENAKFVGGFFEPRYVFSTASQVLYPYLSGRFSVVRLTNDDNTFNLRTTATGYTANGGGGVLLRIASRVNVDLGATYGYTKFSSFKQKDLSTGIESKSDQSNSGSDIVARIGLTLGI
jgi:hypothetical protein